MKEFFKKNKILIGSLVFLFVYSITLVTFATPPGSPYSAGATLDPSCTPGSSNCTVSTLSIGQTIGNSPTDGSVLFVGASGTVGQDNSNFFWDNTNDRLGIGTATPGYALDVDGTTAPTYSSITFNGSGLNDMSVGGTYTASVDAFYQVSIASTGTPDTFHWYKNGTLQASNVPMTGSAQTLDSAVTITFLATTGHNPGVSWTFKAFANSTGNINFTGGIKSNGNFLLTQDLSTNNLRLGYNAGNAVSSVVNTTFGGGIATDQITGAYNTFIGMRSGEVLSSGTGNTLLGYKSGLSLTTGSNNTLVGFRANVSSATFSSSIALGSDATVTASNQFVVGSTNSPISEIYIGKGVTTSSFAAGVSINASGGSGTNITGLPLTIAGGKGTGSGVGGTIYFDTSPSGASGSSLNSLTHRLRIDSTGLVTIGSGNEFAVNSTGNITKINNVTTSWPSSQGGSNTFLKNDGSGNLTWATPTASYGIGNTVNSGSPGSVLFVDGSGQLAQNNSQFFWDYSTNRLGIGNSTPAYRLDISSIASGSSITPNGFSGSVDDLTFGGSYAGTDDDTISICIDSTGTPDTFLWSTGNDTANGVAITGTEQIVTEGITVQFGSTTGHAGDECWTAILTANVLVGDLNIGNAIYQNGTKVFESHGSSYVSVGQSAGSDGQRNTFIGYQAGSVNANFDSVYVGYNSGRDDIGSANTFIGSRAGLVNQGDYNTFFGRAAGTANTSGSSNNFFGTDAGEANTTGQWNVFHGSSAGETNTTASYNTFVGTLSGAVSNADYNTFIGNRSGQGNTSGTRNVFLGSHSGDGNSSGSYNVILGMSSDLSSNQSSSIAIGYNAQITANNQLLIGSDDTNGSITDAYLGQGVTKASPAGITLNATGGSGTNNSGASLTIAGGKSTGNVVGGSIIFQTSDAGGSGSTLRSLSTKAIIVGSGAFGIGDTTPDYLLDVENTGTDGNIFALHDSDGECLHNPEAGSETVTCSSDERLKTNIADASPMLPYLDAFHIRQYDVIASNDHLTGVIAQEVQALYPDLVTVADNGYLSVASPNTWEIIKAIQELDVKVGPLSSLDLNVTGSLGSLIKEYLEDVTNGLTKIFTGEVHTDLLCVGQTCVTESQLQTLINQQNNNGGNNNGGGGNPNPDTTPPTITLIGDPSITLSVGDTYEEQGATATDDTDGDITVNIQITNNVDTNTPGTYTVRYTVEDSSGNQAEVTREVVVS